MIEISGHCINTRHVAVVGAVTRTRGMRYAFEVMFAGNETPLRFVFDRDDDAALARESLIARTESDDDALTAISAPRVGVATPRTADADRPISVIRRSTDASAEGARVM
ncbi:hypothetical protein [Lysobacter claricitrinus]|uniref:hypothetical protein n=1 Tax=Lysobacter claricitrinus TaxID=3367728 RepID=UPI0037DB1A22